MSDWEEIKRLAADFQRTQTSQTLQRISERNCIDIIKKLTDLKLIELIYTCDGKEFLTFSHLQKEIKDEVYVNGGRVQLHELATALNVDYQHVENMAKQIVAEKPDEYNLILGQIIHSVYKATLERQIHDTMICTGQLSIADFSKSIDLPSEFLATLVKELMPNVLGDFVVSQDERTYYTTDMMDQYKSLIAGTLMAISRPTTVASIMKKLDISERLFMPIVDGLIKDGKVDATVENRAFIPAIYAREQNDWVDSFYTSNLYIEYDVLLRKDIKQPKAFLKKRFPTGVQLKTCFVSPALMAQVEALIEECITTNGLIDISFTLPSSIQIEDIEQMLNDIFKNKKQFAASCVVLNQTNVCSLGYIATCKESFNSIMQSRAKEHLKEGRLMNYFLGCNKLDSIQKKTKKSPSEPPAAASQKDDKAKGGDKTASKGGELVAADGEGNPVTSKEVSKKKQIDDIEPAAADGEGDSITSKENSKKNQNDDEEPTAADGGSDPVTSKADSKKKQTDEIELTVEDPKKEKHQKKGKASAGTAARAGPADSEDEADNVGNKKSKSKKSGGGAQGREIKQKATKKKYLAGAKGKQGANDDSDSHSKPATSGKQSRSTKGRAARRGVSPDLPTADASAGKLATTSGDSNRGKQATQVGREPLIFLDSNALVDNLKSQTREAGDFSQELFETIAGMLEAELNKKYETLAREVLDEYLRDQAEKDCESGDDMEIDLVE